MHITLITGGSGSEQIQKGLHEYCPFLPIHLIINGYDDGKSTGVLRSLFKNTLGISDFRKNQLLEYGLIYGKNEIYQLLNHRFTEHISSPLPGLLAKIELIPDPIRSFLLEHTCFFFEQSQSNDIDYIDFSFMNIIYCSLLLKHENNMETVCSIIKTQLGLKNIIHVNAHTPFILKGITQNGCVLQNEGCIVDFNDTTDKITDVVFGEHNPMLDLNTEQCIRQSDILLFSCGTQFSSLIPTYKTHGFNEAIQQSNASKYLVLNCEFDNDIINYTGDELLDKINALSEI